MFASYLKRVSHGIGVRIDFYRLKAVQGRFEIRRSVYVVCQMAGKVGERMEGKASTQITITIIESTPGRALTMLQNISCVHRLGSSGDIRDFVRDNFIVVESTAL